MDDIYNRPPRPLPPSGTRFLTRGAAWSPMTTIVVNKFVRALIGSALGLSLAACGDTPTTITRAPVADPKTFTCADYKSGPPKSLALVDAVKKAAGATDTGAVSALERLCSETRLGNPQLLERQAKPWAKAVAIARQNPRGVPNKND